MVKETNLIKTKIQVIREKRELGIGDLATFCSHTSDQPTSFWIFLIGAHEKKEIMILNETRFERIAEILNCSLEDLKEEL